MAAPRLIEVVDGVKIYGTSPIDVRFLYKEIFERGSYRDVQLPARPFVIDAGANVGIFTLFVKRMRPDAVIQAFEPVAELAAAVRQNAVHFRLESVTVHEVALGASPVDSVRFRHYPLRPSGSSLLLEDQTELKELSTSWLSPRLNERMYRGREISVSVAPMSSFLSGDRCVDLLKVDVVGAELALFAGIADEQWPLIDQVIVDAQDVAGRLAAVRDLLRSRGMTTAVRQNPADSGGGINFVVHGRRQ
jgi:FkbM family methyltransferase